MPSRAAPPPCTHGNIQPNLRELHLEQNSLESFAGFSPQPRLQVLYPAIVMAYVVMAYIDMAYIDMAYIDMAYTVMAYTVMALWPI